MFSKASHKFQCHLRTVFLILLRCNVCITWLCFALFVTFKISVPFFGAYVFLHSRGIWWCGGCVSWHYRTFRLIWNVSYVRHVIFFNIQYWCWMTFPLTVRRWAIFSFVYAFHYRNQWMKISHFNTNSVNASFFI